MRYTIHGIFSETIKRYPEKTAVIYKNESISYSELFNQALALGYFLKKQTKQKNTRVGIFLNKSIDQVIAIFGVLFADCIFVPINTSLSQEQIEYIINDCGIDYFISDSAHVRNVKSLFSKNNFNCIILTDNKNSTVLKKCGVLVFHLSDILSRHKNINYTPSQIKDDVSNIIYTSGSTGKSKGIVITHRNLVDGARIVSEYVKITSQDKILGLLSFNFDYGLNQLFSAVYTGAQIVLHDSFFPQDLADILEKEKITGLAGMPVIWARLFNPKFTDLEKSYDFSNLRYVTNSGGSIPTDTIKKMQTIFPKAEIYLMYGLTEAFRSTYLPPEEINRRPNSMGKAIPDVEILVLNKTGEQCKVDEPGELVHRGGCISQGYWGKPEKTVSVFRPFTLLGEKSKIYETVVFSGDIVKRDKEGFLYFVSRKDQLIKTSGFRVSPTEIEDVVKRIKRIEHAVIFGQEDKELGQSIVLLYTTYDKKLIEKKIITDFIKTNLPMYMMPKVIQFIKDFPITKIGPTKIDRVSLKQKYLKNQK